MVTSFHIPRDFHNLPDLDHRILAGIWRLEGYTYSLTRKEFTTWKTPKQDLPSSVPTQQQTNRQEGTGTVSPLPLPKSLYQTGGRSVTPLRYLSGEENNRYEVLLSLHEDGTFRSCDGVDVSDQISGKWEYLDGNLILALDETPPSVRLPPALVYEIVAGEPLVPPKKKLRDTILVGHLVLKSEQPHQQQQQSSTYTSSNDDSDNKDTNTLSSSAPQTTMADPSTLMIEDGVIASGRYTYPKSHPNFFENPMFGPMRTGTFNFRQILGSRSVADDLREEEEEMFVPSDLAGRRFFLSTEPLKFRKQAGRKRYSRWTGNEIVEEIDVTNVNYQVMEIELCHNMTFATVGGLGSANVLRGKWRIMGEKKDHFWMQVSRFGFGRSVSGSVFSEGMGLTQDDEKGFWGEIQKIMTKSNSDEEDNTIEIEGLIMDGYGLEPTSTGRFKMREIRNDRKP